MSIPLTLGAPRRPDPLALANHLVNQRALDPDSFARRARGLIFGPPLLAASTVLSFPADAQLGRIVMELDLDPDELRAAASGPGYEVVRFHVDASADHLAEATTLRLPSPLVVFPQSIAGEMEPVDAATLVVDAHRTPGFAATDSARHISDFLADVAHSDVGFVARAQSGTEVVRILAATVAALRGDDIPAALAWPNVDAMRALVPEAAEAVRGVLLGIEIGADVADAVRDHLVNVGLAPAEEPTT